MMKVLYENEKIAYFREVFRRYGRPVDFRFEGDKRTYFFSNGLVVTVVHRDGKYFIEESKVGLKEFLERGEFTKIAVIYSLTTSIIAVLSAILEAYTGLGGYVFTIGLLSSSLTTLAATIYNIRKAR